MARIDHKPQTQIAVTQNIIVYWCCVKGLWLTVNSIAIWSLLIRFSPSSLTSPFPIHDSISFDVFPLSTLQTWSFTWSKARLQRPLQTACLECSIHLLTSNSYQQFLSSPSRCVESASSGVGDLTWRAGDETVQTEHGFWSSAVLSHLLHRLPADAAVF